MYKIIQFDIKAIDNLKLGKFERDANNWYTHSYIPGSVVKGAITWNIVQKNGYVPKEILNGDTIFYNAYPLLDENTTIPMMQGYIGDKQQIRSNKKEVKIQHSFNGTKPKDAIPFSNYEFVESKLKNSYVRGYNPNKVDNLHINKKDASDGNKTRLFRYEAVKKGECFRGFIKVAERLSGDIYDILDKKVIYFGGSRGSGYGKCEISNLKYISDICLYSSDTDVQNDLYIYLLSDAILYYSGKVHTHLPSEVLKEKLDIKGDCSFVDSFISLGKAATYNTMYHTNTVCYTSVSKGSLFKYKVNEKIDPDKIKKLTLDGIGLRKENGYGQITILSSIPKNLVILKYIRVGSINKKDISLNTEDTDLINTILKNIFYSRVNLQIERLVIDLLNGKRKPTSTLQSQIGKLLNLFQNSIYKSENGFKRELDGYLSHMRDKKDKRVWQQLNRLTFSCRTNEYEVVTISAQKLLLDFISNDSNSIDKIFENLIEKGVKMDAYKYPEKNDHADVLYNLQQMFFISLFNQLLRMKG